MTLPLYSEDGAEFFGHYQYIEPNKFRACCYAALDEGSRYFEEMPAYGFFPSEDTAKQWISSQAVHRGFSEWHNLTR